MLLLFIQQCIAWKNGGLSTKLTNSRMEGDLPANQHGKSAKKAPGFSYPNSRDDPKKKKKQIDGWNI